MGFDDLFSGHSLRDGISGLHVAVAILTGGLRDGKTQPHVSGNVILWYALAERIHDPEVGLRESHSLVGDEAKPPDRFSMVLRDTPSVPIHHSQVVLCKAHSLLSSEAKPPDCLGIVLWDALANVMKRAELVLSAGVSLDPRQVGTSGQLLHRPARRPGQSCT